MRVEEENLLPFLEKLERSVQYQVAVAALPIALLVTNLDFLLELDKFWPKVFLTLGVIPGLFCMLFLGFWLALAKSAQAHLFDDERKELLLGRVERNLMLARKLRSVTQAGIALEYSLFVIALIILIWSSDVTSVN